MYYTWDTHPDIQAMNGAMTLPPHHPMHKTCFWGAFRDVHSYEKLNNVDFSVALDHPEESSCWIFDDCVGTPETMLSSSILGIIFAFMMPDPKGQLQC